MPLGPPPLGFEEQESYLRATPSFQKWTRLKGGEELSYNGTVFVKGKPGQEVRLLRQIFWVRQCNIRQRKRKKCEKQAFVSKPKKSKVVVLAETKKKVARLRAEDEEEDYSSDCEPCTTMTRRSTPTKRTRRKTRRWSPSENNNSTPARTKEHGILQSDDSSDTNETDDDENFVLGQNSNQQQSLTQIRDNNQKLHHVGHPGSKRGKGKDDEVADTQLSKYSTRRRSTKVSSSNSKKCRKLRSQVSFSRDSGNSENNDKEGKKSREAQKTQTSRKANHHCRNTAPHSKQCESLVGISATSLTAALVKAAKEGNLDDVRMYLESGGTDINASTVEGETALLQACYHGHSDTVHFLLQFPTLDINKAMKDSGATALHWAVRREHVDVVRELLQHPEVQINQQDYSHGWSALHDASMNDNLEIMQLLLNHPQINTALCDHDDQTALDFATRQQQEAIVQLLQKTSGTTPAPKCPVIVAQSNDKPATDMNNQPIGEMNGKPSVNNQKLAGDGELSKCENTPESFSLTESATKDSMKISPLSSTTAATCQVEGMQGEKTHSTVSFADDYIAHDTEDNSSNGHKDHGDQDLLKAEYTLLKAQNESLLRSLKLQQDAYKMLFTENQALHESLEEHLALLQSFHQKVRQVPSHTNAMPASSSSSTVSKTQVQQEGMDENAITGILESGRGIMNQMTKQEDCVYSCGTFEV